MIGAATAWKLVKSGRVAGLALAIAAAAASFAPAAAEDTVTFVSWGGSFQDGLRAAILKPAAQALKLDVREDTTSGMKDLRAQITAKAVTWDVVQYSIDECSLLSRDGALEPIDYHVVKSDGIPPELVNRDWIGFINYSKVIAWQTSKYGQNGPQTWADFWDLKRFPGTRSLFATVNDSLEAALMADGVPMDQVYKTLSTPAGIDRAFKKIEEIAPSVKVWYSGGSQAAQLMKDGEIDAMQMASNRATSIQRDGAKVGYTFNQGIVEVDCLLVPRGAPHKAAAMQLINAAMNPQYQAEAAKLLGMGPSNIHAFEAGVLSPEQAAQVNTAPENLKRQLIIDSAFYADHVRDLQERLDAIKEK